VGVARALPLVLLLAAAAAAAKDPEAFKRQLAETEIDWSAGTITARGGAAPDLRMPNPGAARPGAERRARAAAEEKLRLALREVAPDRRLDEKAALAAAAVSRIEYQSNGGVVLWLAARVSDALAAKPAPVALRVSSMPFSIAPVVTAGGKTVALGAASYRPGADAPKDAVVVQRDGQGRLVLADKDARLLDSLAGAAVVIYLEKPMP
jgi:hypothetical protein